ncbi:helicase [Bradyrhizobium sp. ORS 375]|uniref:helicase n=1 Tax=Bradyrhizobium sp. (strain ORS 375) TaxID=566679 RepID=UPI001FCBD283|nr:helicase [Bradyrhizobium sp. ORS 375]
MAAIGPPEVDSDIRMWIDVPSDPDRRPLVRQRVTVTVPTADKEQLIAAGHARPEHCAAAVGHSASAALWTVRLHLEQRPDIVERLDRYLAGSWAAWAAAERPRRRTIALHRRLCEMARVTGAARNDANYEIVWGIGVSRWRRHGRELDLPLLERLVEIEVLDSSEAEIRIRPRMVGATANLKAFEPLTPAAKLAGNTAEQLLERGAELSPFQPASFEPILSAIGSQLDPQGIYCPTMPDSALLLPEENEQLVVSDRWVIFARPRSDALLLRDIRRLKRALDYMPGNEGCLAALAHLLRGTPDDSNDGTRRRLPGVIGDPIDIAPAAQIAADRGDLFFPLPTNSDQMEMVRQLQRSDGLVVKGAIASDRASAIANVVCHHLALGLRVLVVSRSEAGLSLLSEKLPLPVRDLTVDLTGSDKDVLKHAESVVSRLLSIIDTTDLHDQAEHVNELEREIIAASREIARLDDEVTDIANRTMLRSGSSGLPLDALATLIADRETYAWFADRPLRFLGETDLIVAAVDQARAARLRLGDDLGYLDDQQPDIAALPDAAALTRLHLDLQRIENSGDGRLAREAIEQLDPEGADKFANDLDALAAAHGVIAEEPWLAALSPVGSTSSETSIDGNILIDYARDASSLLSLRAGFLVRPVEMPADAFVSEELLRTVERLAAGERPFAAFSLSGRALKQTLDTIRVAGFAPKSAADWAHVRDHLTWRRHLHSLDVRWRSLAAELGAPTPEPNPSHSLTGHERLVRSVEVALVAATLARRNILATASKLPLLEAEIAGLLYDGQRLTALASAIRSTAVRIGKQRNELIRLDELFEGCGAIAARVRAEVLSQIGRDEVDADDLAIRWNAIRTWLHGLHERRHDIELINELHEAMTEAGAPAFARRLKTEPAVADGEDQVLLADWMMAWNWAVLMHQTEGLGQQRLLQDLSDQRVTLETRLRRLFEQVVVARMHLALAQSAGSAVRQAFTRFMTTWRKMAATCSGPSAFRLRQVAREALESCHEGIPCQLMPTWRVAEQLPARLGAFDLVVIDHASQSDLRELTVLLRGRKVLAMGEDHPAKEMIGQGQRISELHGATGSGGPTGLGGVPAFIRQLMPPKAVLCDLLELLFPDRMIRLREHARRDEPVALPMASSPLPIVRPQAPVVGADAAASSGSTSALPTRPSRPAYSLEDEIATVAENLSLARQEQRAPSTTLMQRPAPDWLRSRAESDMATSQAHAARRTAYDGAADDATVSSFETSAPSLPPWIDQDAAMADAERQPGTQTTLASDDAAKAFVGTPAKEPETPESTTSATVERGRDAAVIEHPPLSARRDPALEHAALPRRALRRRIMAAAAVVTVAMVGASIYWQPAAGRLATAWQTVTSQVAVSWNAASPAAALPAGTEPRKVTAERMTPDAKSTAARDGASATTGSAVEPIISHAVLYQEDPQDPLGKRYLGKVTWRVERAAGSVPASIKGDVEIDKQMKATLSLRPNKEADMPASHILEVKFNWPDDPGHAGVDTLKGVSMKAREAGRGSALSTLTAKVTPEFFMIALSANEVDKTRNVLLLKGKEWIDIPIVYNGGSRAVLAIEKGADGERAFADAFTAWGQ